MLPNRYFTRVLLLVTFLSLFGLVFLFSATGILGVQRYGNEFYYVLRQALVVGIGFSGMILLSYFDYRKLYSVSFGLVLITLVLLLATLFTSLSHEALGASRWLRLGPLHFQPSELAKIVLPIYFASVLAKLEKKSPPPKFWCFHLGFIVVSLLLILKQPDLGTTLIISLTLLGIAFIAGLRLTYILGILGSGTIVALFLMLHTDYRRRRLTAFLNPWADPQGSGFQSIQSFLSFHSGKLFGMGIGNGNSKLFYLPEVHTDFIFALVGEEIGFIGASVFVVSFCYLSYLLFKASLYASDTFGRYLGLAIAIVFSLQVVINLGGVTGFIPVKGLPLPFFSWGRSALLIQFVMLGLVLSILRKSYSLAKT